MSKKQPQFNKGQIVIYQPKYGGPRLEVELNKDTVWLSLDQMAFLFGRDKSVISRHIKNIFKEKELSRNSVVANFATTAPDGKVYHIDYYNLDVIISVGYRVKSHNGVRFRIWATKILKNHLIKGYTLNQKRLKETQLTDLEQAVTLIKNTLKTKKLKGSEAKGLLDVITKYANSWLLLQKYDEEKLSLPKKLTKAKYKLEYTEAIEAITDLKQNLMAKKQASDLFGKERGEALAGIIGNIYQSFGGKELYASIDAKAAHLLYFIIKDHPFTDGNKRIGSFLFIVFLSRNNYLVNKYGELKFNDNALVALALLIAESDPKQKDILIKLIINFLSKK